MSAWYLPGIRVVPRSISFVPLLETGLFLFLGRSREMKERLQKIREEAVARIQASKSPEALNDVRVSVLGKKGELTALLKSMKDVAPEERPAFGQ